ncbi:hypothetical protein U1Q18_048626 [Sarracenia purpurea var. burkii]
MNSKITLLDLLCISFIFAATPQSSISTSIFDEAFTKRPYFVDKTELLGEFFKSKHGPDYNYVSYPSKFGKTTNLRMIKRFCQLRLNSQNFPLNWTQTESYHLFSDLKISRNRDVFSAHLAQHPVIWLDLNFTLKGVVTEEQIIAGMNLQIKKCYSEYRWLIELAEKSDTYFYNESMQSALRGDLSGQQMVHGLLHLARLLKDYFKVGVVLLIDNYDFVLNTLFVCESKARMVLKPLTRAMLKACLSPRGEYVSHAFIAGVSLWNYNLKDDNSTSMSVQKHAFLLDTSFWGYFGFTEPEIRAICDQYKCTEDEKWLLKQLYDGYTNPTLSQSGLKSLYNPFSVIEFIAHRQTEIPFRNYWIRSQDTNFIYLFLRGLHFRKQFVELLKYESIIIGDRESIQTSYWTFDHLRTWYEPYNSSLLGFLFDSGYLTYDSKDMNQIRIPNDDIKQFLSSVLIQFYKENDYEIDKLRKCLDQMLVGQIVDSDQTILSLKQHLKSTLKLMNTRYGVHLNSTSPGTNINNDLPRAWIFKPKSSD